LINNSSQNVNEVMVKVIWRSMSKVMCQCQRWCPNITVMRSCLEGEHEADIYVLVKQHCTHWHKSKWL